jgi:DNA mismatch repair protein MutS2
MIFPLSFENKVGFDRIKELLTGYCTGTTGRELVENISFSASYNDVSSLIDQTWEMQQLLSATDPVYIDNEWDVREVLNKIKIEGAFATEEELFCLKRHYDSLRSLLAYFRKSDQNICPVLKEIASAVKYYPAVSEQIDRIIDRNGVIRDTASPKLKEIRSEIKNLSVQVTRKLQSVLKNARTEGIVDPDAAVSVRYGRGVIPVNVYNKRKIAGLIHDQSATGKTVYIEPAEVVELNNDIVDLEYEEKREIVRILTAVSDKLRPYVEDLIISALYLGDMDFVKARARLGNRLGSVRPSLSETPCLKWFGAVHPLLYIAFEKLPDRHVVPLDLTLEPENRIVVISGPNAGGKSVCLKTIGLLQYMLQCGLTIPVREGSEAGIFSKVFIDIGDEQSIENDLSTYSSHLIGMKHFLKYAGNDTLVLIDEFGSGTEPVIGGAIAEAILTELNDNGVYGVVTTHYTNLKHFASNTQGVVNGAMLFDNHLMQPLFRLVTGRPGSSFAFEIARKIGLPEHVLNEASEKAGKDYILYDKILREIGRDRRYWEKKRDSVRRLEKRLEEMEKQYEEGLKTINQKKKEIITAAKREAEDILQGANRIIETTVREIKEAEAEREKTREARRKLDDFREELRSRGTESVELKGKNFKRGKARKKATVINTATNQKIPDLIDKTAQEIKITLGSYVRMTESDSAGIIEEINDQIATVSFGNVIVRLPLEKLLPASKAEYERQHRRSSKPVLDWEATAKRAGFSSQLDLRGMRVEEAIPMVQEFLDRAWSISYPVIRILHGKGYGVLRQQVRQYLSTLGYIRSFDDAPVDQGGSGITIVELDV